MTVVPILVEESELPIIEKALARALRTVRGDGRNIKVNDTPAGIVVIDNARKDESLYEDNTGEWVEITGWDSDGTLHSWKHLEHDPDASTSSGGKALLAEPDPAFTSDTSAIAVNGQKYVPIGTRVWLIVLGHSSDDDKLRFGFRLGHPQEIFGVSVEEDGTGVAGDDTTDCTFKYNIYVRGETVPTGQKIISGIAPTKPRFTKTTYNEGPDGTIGYAMWDTDGSFILTEVLEEFPQDDACT